MLVDRHDVGELGCADAFGTRIVLQATKKVTVYDANPVFIEDVRRRYREEWPLQTAVHERAVIQSSAACRKFTRVSSKWPYAVLWLTIDTGYPLARQPRKNASTPSNMTASMIAVP